MCFRSNFDIVPADKPQTTSVRNTNVVVSTENSE